MSVAATSRRSVLRGALVALVAGVAGFVTARRSGAARESGGSAANGYGPAAEAGGDAARAALAPLADVPTGGGLVLADDHVVLTRDGDSVHAFSATCTHQGCTVSEVSDGVIRCPCHGSSFDAGTGEVVTGPATRALPVVDVEVRDGSVYRAGGG